MEGPPPPSYSLLIGLCNWMVTIFGGHGDNKKMLPSFACVDDFELDELIFDFLLQNLNFLYVVDAKLWFLNGPK